MKKIVVFLIVLSQILIAQAPAPWICPVSSAIPPPIPPPPVVLQPTNCIQLLNDLAPKNHDRVLKVNVKVWVFAPISGSGAWTNSNYPMTQTVVDQFIANANSSFTSIPAVPQLTVAGTPTSVPHAKIELTLKSWTVINNDAGYGNVELGIAQRVPSYSLAGVWYDADAINVYVGTQTVAVTKTLTVPPFSTYTAVEQVEAIGVPNVLGTTTNNCVFITPAFYKSQTNPVYDFLDMYGSTFAHEVGHVLGLDHSTGQFTNPVADGERRSRIEPAFGCCILVEANDYVMESYDCWTCIPYQGCDTPGASDNMMSQNSGCNRYL